MRIATLMTMLAAPLAMAACGSAEEANAPEQPSVTAAKPMAGMTPAEAAKSGKTATGQGTVTAIDAEVGTVTIKHGPIEAVKWPAMTMAFQAGEAQRQNVAVGDEVTFDFRTTEAGSEITSISKR